MKLVLSVFTALMLIGAALPAAAQEEERTVITHEDRAMRDLLLGNRPEDPVVRRDCSGLPCVGECKDISRECVRNTSGGPGRIKRMQNCKKEFEACVARCQAACPPPGYQGREPDTSGDGGSIPRDR